MSLPSLSIRRPVTTLMFYIGVVLLGVIAFQNLAVDFLPAIKIPKLTVQTSYPNVSPEEIENTVTQPIEATLGTVTGAKKVSSVSREGLSIVTVEFYWGTNMDFAMLEVREKLDQLRASLPREAGRPTILRIDPSTEPIMSIAVSEGKDIVRPERNLLQTDGVQMRKTRNGETELRTEDENAGILTELKETARALLKRRLEQVHGVAQVSVLGGVEREIHVNIDTRTLHALGLTLDQVSQALANANLNLPGGTIKRGLFRYALRTLGEFTRVDELRQVVVGQTPSGRPIRIADIGMVNDTYRERMGITRYNGKEIIALQVRKEAGANTIEVSKRVHAVLQQLRAEYPSLQLTVIADQAEFIAKSIADVQQAIVIGALLAFLVLFLFLRSPKYPVIIGLTMPISILATVVAMYFLGINVNIISLTGLALGIGMLGDNAIIVIENVTRLREKGLGMVEAALRGAQEINLAVTASTLTNVAIFLPIIFVEGVASQLFVDMGVTMTISLLVSLLVAATLVPMLVSRELSLPLRPLSFQHSFQRQRAVVRRLPGRIWYWFTIPVRLVFLSAAVLIVESMLFITRRSQALAPRLYGALERFSAAAYQTLERFLDWVLLHRRTVLGTTLLVFGLSIVLAFFIPSEPAPDIDQSRFTVQVLLPKGTTLQGTSEFVRNLEDACLKLPGIQGVYARIGVPEEHSLWTVTEVSLERAELEIKVKNEQTTGEVIEHVRQYLAGLQPSFAGVEFAVKRRGTTFEQILRPEQNDIKVRILGREPAVAHRLAHEFAEKLQGVRGLVDLRTSLQLGSPEYQLIVDREKASRYGLSVYAVAQHLAGLVRGKEATYLSDFDRKITIRVQPADDMRQSIDRILSSSMPVAASSVPVRELVTWQRTEGFAEIWRENGQRAVIIAANVSGRSIGSVVDEIQEKAKHMALPAGYQISVGGETEEIQESFRSLFIIILLSLFLVYMILAAEYESVLYPFVILLTSPLAFIGAIGAMAITGQNYNVMSLIGLVIMIGAVDNDAVIAVDIITALRRQGKNLRDAIQEGMRLRLRPILMTTATTILGIIPLVFEFGTGSELVRALTAPLVGGLIASTIFTLVAIPVVYTYVDRWALGRTNVEV
jgi:HAE1 family hydrophobic/amphiphilic exporter-1